MTSETAAENRPGHKWTSRYPELGTGPIPVEPLISEELFEEEREKIFRHAWLYMGGVEQIPEPGDYKLRRVDVLKTSLIIVRDKAGKIRAFHNICTHRGNKVVPEKGDFESFGRARGNALTCRFHGWVFGTDGDLRHVPKEDLFPDLDKACRGLKEVACETWEGFIFVNLEDRPKQSLTEFLGGMGHHFAGYPYGEATCSKQYYSVLHCNWKVSLYAFTEAYHVPTIHAGTFPSLARVEHENFRFFGPHRTSAIHVPPVPGLEPTPVTAIAAGILHASDRHRPHPEQLPKSINPDQRGDFQFELPVTFPNLGIHLGAGNGYPGMAFFTHEFWPIAHDRTLWIGTNYFREPRTVSEKFALQHVNALHRNAWLEDTWTMEDSQDAMKSGVLEELVLQDEEIMIRHANKVWHDYMGRG